MDLVGIIIAMDARPPEKLVMNVQPSHSGYGSNYAVKVYLQHSILWDKKIKSPINEAHFIIMSSNVYDLPQHYSLSIYTTNTIIGTKRKGLLVNHNSPICDNMSRISKIYFWLT